MNFLNVAGPQTGPVTLAAEVNACGPFAHSYFEFQGVTLSHEGPLEGRAKFLAFEALEFLDSLAAELGKPKKKLTILEVGSYDGWIAHQLWEAGYRKISTLEPRRHNIRRGRRLRSLLGIRDRVLHLCGSLDSPSPIIRLGILRRKFDAVISFGVIHHLDNPVDFVRKVHRMTQHGALIEGVTLSDDIMTQDLVSKIEPKDVIYDNHPKVASIYGVKLESGYTPGSRVGAGTVLVPGVRAFMWALQSAGFDVVWVKNGFGGSQNLENTHRKHLHTSTFRLAPSDESSIGTPQGMESAALVAAETINCKVSLGADELSILEEIVALYPEANNPRLRDQLETVARTSSNPSLITDLIHSPQAKLRFNQAKRRIEEGNPAEAIAILRTIVNTPCDDWRTVYRSFFLLSQVDRPHEKKWKKLLELCNPDFPVLD